MSLIVQDLYEKLYGFKTEKLENPVTDYVTSTATQLLKNDPCRLSYILFNLGSTDLYLAFDNAPSDTRGILVSKSGGYFSLDFKDDGILVTYPLYGVTSSAGYVFLVGTKIFGD
jgi:hypothetical protein